MKKNNLKITLVIIAVIAMVVTLMYLSINQHKIDNRPFKKQDFPKTIVVENNTEYERIDTIVYVLASNIFNLDTLKVIIYPMINKINSEKYDFYAYTSKIYFKSHEYLVFINPKLSFSNLKMTMSHEFIHIEQYEKDGLEIINNLATFKGRKYDLRDIEYMDRPFEIEAFNEQNEILIKLDSLLYE